MPVDVRRRSEPVDSTSLGPDLPIAVDVRPDLLPTRPGGREDPVRVPLDELVLGRGPVGIPILPDDEITRWFG